MRNNDNLFQLIKSLTKSEKRYFKIDAQKQGENKNFLILFDLIDAQEEYNEEQLKKKLAQTEIIKNFASYKNYLFESIIDSLQNFYKDDTISQKVNKLYDKIKVLERKGLYKICLESISKAQKLAIEYNLYAQLVKLYATEHNVLLRMGNKDKDLIDEVTINYGNVAHIFGNIIDFDQLYKKTYTLYIMRPDEKEKLEEAFNYPLLEDESKALSFEALRIFNTLNAIKYRYKNEYEKVFYYEHNLIRNYERRYKDIATSKPLQYSSTINNFLEACINANILEHVDLYLSILKKMISTINDENTSTFIRQVYFQRKLEYLNLCAETEDAIDLIKEIKQSGIMNSDQALDNITETLLFEITKTFFLIQDYKEALHHINNLINKPQLVADFFKGPMEILFLMIHFELKNMTLLESSVRNIERRLRKNNSDGYQFEFRMLHFYKSVMNSREIKQDKNFVTLKNDIIQMPRNSIYFFKAEKLWILPWIESHLQKKSMKELVAPTKK